MESINGIEAIRLYEAAKLSQASRIQSEVKEETKKYLELELKENKAHISRAQYSMMLKNRPLLNYRPIKNSFTKKGDQQLLAHSLGISIYDIDKLINHIIETEFENSQYEYYDELHWRRMHDVDEETKEITKDYVMRHGTKEQVLEYLKWHLHHAGNILDALYFNLESDLLSLNQYYLRPCHMLDSVSANNLYDTIHKELKNAHNKGDITMEQNLKAAQDTLDWIYKIQTASGIQRALRFVLQNG